MPPDQRDLLTVLKHELEFLEQGGYERYSEKHWRPLFIFEDSPTCMNYGSRENPEPCTDCVLMQLVPPQSREEKVPCRHIPLNEAGETIESFYRTGTQRELDEALGKWLRKTIQRLEEERAQKQDSHHQAEKACAAA